MNLSRRATPPFLIAMLAISGAILPARAAAPVATEFPAAKDIEPPPNMSAAAKGHWEERLAQLAASATPAGVVNDLGALPVIERAFTPLDEGVEKLEQARDSLPSHLRTSWIIPADVSAGPLGHCIECHTPGSHGNVDYANRLGAGGRVFAGPWGQSVSTNITPTGLSRWTDDEIKTMISRGLRPDGSRMQPPMGYGYYATIAETDLDAIVAYLRSLPDR